MFTFWILGSWLILGSSGRQLSGTPPGITVYKTTTPGQYLVQPVARPVPPEVPSGYSQIAVVVVPRHQGTIFHAAISPRTAPEPPGDGFNQDPSLYYQQSGDGHESFQNIIKPPNLAYAQFLPYLPLKKHLIYPKQKIPIHQFLKEVTPTTKTTYSDQQAASLRYAQATPPQAVDQELQKLVTHRVLPHTLSIPYVIHSETLQDHNQPQPYQQILHPQQFLQSQQNIQPQQYVQTNLQYTVREGLAGHQPKYQQPQLQPQNTHGSLTYIPVNPVMFQKPLVDEDTPTAKSTIYVSQKTPLKKYHLPQSVNEQDSDENLEKTPTSLRKVPRPQQFPQYIPVQPQQILLPLIPQQPTVLNEATQTQLQPQLLKYHQIRPLQPETLKYQQIQQEAINEQRPKKVLPQFLRQPQPQIVVYQHLPLQQPLQPEAYADHRPYQQLQPSELINIPKQPLRYLLHPQLLAYQPLPVQVAVQPANLRQTQIQPESLDYETPHQNTVNHQDLQQEIERNEEKQDIPVQEPVLRQPVKKLSSRSRKYRPQTVRVQQENEEPQNENQDNQPDNQEEFRIQYQDGLKPQATTYAGLRYRRPLQTSSKNIVRTKDRAVQIIDEEDEDYK